eukprot:CAMPEP_0174846012 /NCGR_PEP_ID=MMETSP1114-20130205/12071_1 /TAXON_ID=312471 /ORGANISM="Neobodo designis, Strain CCAP 1951/1" /LENGTH=50 /DNA_ID=CAMNT_0016080269 /DNA_START=31 /DNA_END=180 /DNA_ORIENTATION=+
MKSELARSPAAAAVSFSASSAAAASAAAWSAPRAAEKTLASTSPGGVSVS